MDTYGRQESTNGQVVDLEKCEEKSTTRRRTFIFWASTIVMCLCISAAVSILTAFVIRLPLTQKTPIDVPANCVRCSLLYKAVEAGFTINARDIEVKMFEDKSLCCLRSEVTSYSRQKFVDMVIHSSAPKQSQPSAQVGLSNGTATPANETGGPSTPTPRPPVASRQVQDQVKVNKAIAFMGLDESLPVHLPDHYVIKEWGTEGIANFRRDDIGYNHSNGHFKILKDGIYVAHCHLGLFSTRENVVFTQSLYKSNPAMVHSGNTYLAGDTERVTRGTHAASNIFSVLYLQQNDELHVNVTAGGTIVESPRFSYFSIHWLSL